MRKTTVRKHTRKLKSGERTTVIKHAREIHSKRTWAAKNKDERLMARDLRYGKKNYVAKKPVEKKVVKKEFPSEFKKYVSFVDKEGKNVKLEISYDRTVPSQDPSFGISGNRDGSMGQITFVPKNDAQRGIQVLWDKYHLKSDVPMNIEVMVDNVIEAIESVESERGFDDLGLTGWKLTALKELSEKESETFTDYNEEGDGITFVGANDYLVFQNEDDAETFAIERVKEDLEDNPNLFSRDFIESHINTERLDRKLQEDAEESARNYYNDIESEGDSTYGNRLYEELVSGGYLEESDILNDDGSLKDSFDEYKIESAREEAIESLAEDRMSSGGIEYLREMFVAHFLARYDGQEIELPSGAYAYKN